MTHLGIIRNSAAAFAASLVFAASALAQMDAEKVLHIFNGASDGAIPSVGLLSDSAGNLYGTTVDGGNNSTACQVLYGQLGCGVVYKLTHTSNGWRESVLYTFSGGSDGGIPVGPMVFDFAGNLYGTTAYGGDSISSACVGDPTVGNPPGCGVVFELTPTNVGPWAETVLHTFRGGADGAIPFFNGVIMDSEGDLFGETWNGGNTSSSCFNSLGCGVVYKLTHTAKGEWVESLLFTFADSTAGSAPSENLTLDSAGNLYGVAYIGGDQSVSCFSGYVGCGLVFKLTPSSKGPWTETVLHTFTGGADGGIPLANVILDAKGNVYGTTIYGGDSTTTACNGSNGLPPGCGVVYKLTSPMKAGGTWTETVLYSFTGGADGALALSPLVFDAAGNLFSSVAIGGDLSTCGGSGCGLVFKLTPTTTPPWTEQVLFDFPGGAGGSSPQSNLILFGGNIYGVAESGGNTSACNRSGCGVVFKLE